MNSNDLPDEILQPLARLGSALRAAGRQFFEVVIRHNLDLGRPDRVSLLFATRLRRNTPSPDPG